MTDTKSEAREFWIDISDCEDDDALPPIAYVEHPKQGPLPWQEKLVHVIQFSAHQDLKAKHERVLQMLEIATKALKQIAGPRKKDGSYFYSIPEIQQMGDDGADTDNARYALEKIDKIESLK